jgi:hypothetical protein
LAAASLIVIFLAQHGGRTVQPKIEMASQRETAPAQAALLITPKAPIVTTHSPARRADRPTSPAMQEAAMIASLPTTRLTEQERPMLQLAQGRPQQAPAVVETESRLSKPQKVDPLKIEPLRAAQLKIEPLQMTALAEPQPE